MHEVPQEPEMSGRTKKLADFVLGSMAIMAGCERDHAENTQRNRQSDRDRQNPPPRAFFCDLVGFVQTGHDGPGTVQSAPNRNHTCQYGSCTEDRSFV